MVSAGVGDRANITLDRDAIQLFSLLLKTHNANIAGFNAKGSYFINVGPGTQWHVSLFDGYIIMLFRRRPASRLATSRTS